MVIESLDGYSSLGWHLCSVSVCITSVHDLLAFIVSGEKSGVILIGLGYLPYLNFSLTVFVCFVLFCFIRLVFWLLCDRRNFFSGPNYLEFCRPFLCSWQISFIRLVKISSIDPKRHRETQNVWELLILHKNQSSTTSRIDFMTLEYLFISHTILLGQRWKCLLHQSKNYYLSTK